MKAQKLSFAVSIGVTEMSGNARGIDDLLKQADEALYQAKASGRNRVVGQ
jgi:diguanylate cyclase (GGDEF)-like protein